MRAYTDTYICVRLHRHTHIYARLRRHIVSLGININNYSPILYCMSNYVQTLKDGC